MQALSGKSNCCNLQTEIYHSLMPLVYQQHINHHTKLGVWNILADELHDGIFEGIKDISHPHKRLQHAAGRRILSALYPDFPIQSICIAPSKKPFLIASDYFFSISHCGNYAAAIVSQRQQVGIDIEIPKIQIENVQHKFLSGAEKLLVQSWPMPIVFALTLAWSVKEAVYKWYGLGGVDFIRDIQLKSLVAQPTHFEIQCTFLKGHALLLKLNAINFNGTSLVWLQA